MVFLASLERDRVPLARPIAAKEVPLVDRIEEMNVLKEAVYKAAHGEGGLVFVYGEAGIGKTRLLRELGAYAQSRGVQVLHGRCPGLFRMDGVPPYVIWKEVIKDYFERCTFEQLNRVIGYYPAEVAKLVPELSQKLRTIPQSFPINPEQEQNRLFEAVSQFITNISQETPLLVVLDDLQWTDPSSLLLLHYLARGVQKTQMLLLSAYRSTDIDEKHPLTPVLAELNRERLPQEIQLKRMSPNDVSEIIKNILEQEDVSEEFCKLIFDKTRGNPFFAEEVIKSLKEEGAIYREEGKWKFKEISTIEFPKSVKNVLKSRIGRLDGECQNVLTMASFIGNDFGFDALREVMGFDESRLLELLDAIFKTGLIKERAVHGERACSFADILVRDVVYEEVSPLKRTRLHGIVGRALEKVYAAKIDEHFGELASHFFESGDKEKALDYFLKAGEKAQNIYANNEATSYFQSALRLLEEKEGELAEKARVLERLGDIKKLVGEYDLCLKHWNEALLLGTQLDEKAKVAELHRKMAAILWRELGKVEQAREHFDKALSILEAEPESVHLATLYATRARMSWFTEDVTKARSWAEKGLDLGKKLNAHEAIAVSYEVLGLVSGGAGDTKESVEYLEKALKIALDNGYVDIALRLYNNLAVNLPPGEQNERILNYFEKGLELAKKAGDSHHISWFENTLAGWYFEMGNIDKALSLAKEADSLNRKTNNLFNLPGSTASLGFYYHVLGEWNKSEQYLKEALEISQRTGIAQQIGLAYENLGWCYYDRSEYAKAKEYFEKMCEVFEKWGQKFYSVSWSHEVAANYIELGEIDKASIILNETRKFAQEKQIKHLIAIEDATRALLLRAEKKLDESIGLFEKSLTECEALGARKWYNYGLAKKVFYEYARTCLERNQPGDMEKADKLFNQALEVFQRMGAKPDTDKTMKMMERLQPTPPAQTVEKAVSPAAYVCDEVQGDITAEPRELKIGESLELDIAVRNTSKEEPILMTKITGVIPEGFAVAKKPELSLVKGDCLDIRDKRLEPSKTEIVKLVLTPKMQGTFQIKPRIVYLDENGKEKTCEPKPVTIIVKELGLKGWLKGER